MWYAWNKELSPEFPSSVGIGQGSALLALCLSPLLKEFECRVQTATLISYVDNGTIIVQSDTWAKNLTKLQQAYKVVYKLTEAMGLVLEHNKSKGFHFSRKHGDDNPTINFGYAPYTGATPLCPGTTWRYLGFFFDHSLTFREHVKCYTNKSLTLVRAMLALGNSVRRLRPKHKRMLCRPCVLPIATYGSRLWLYKGAQMKGPLDALQKMQRCACLWITGAFKTSPVGAAKTIAGIPLIYLHVKKLVEQSHVCTRSLQASHAFCHLVDGDHKFSVKTLKDQIRGDLKSPVTEAWLNLDLSSCDLDPIHQFSTPGLQPRDLYPNHIVYDIVTPLSKMDKECKKFISDCKNVLFSAVSAASNLADRICIVTDASTPPLPLQSIAAYHVWYGGDLYDDWAAASLTTSDDAELHAITGGIFQANNIGLENVHQVHIFSNSTNMLQHCMDASHHSEQHLSLFICGVLIPWFKQDHSNHIFLHHITDGVELQDHQLVHILATLTRIEAGTALIISADYARHGAVT